MDDPKTSQQFFSPRVRLAPSPTGWLHVGTARTGLFNYLFAKKHGGKFILRIEDTDKIRSKDIYTENIINGLHWLGLDWDEGPGKEGEYGPYFQSQRTQIYAQYLQQLLDEGKAYYCFCTPEELEAQKQDMIAQGLAPKYSGKCRHLSPETIQQYLKEKKPSVIRLKMPNKVITFNDLIRGKVEFDLNLIGDIVIAKSLTEPLYNFSVVIDDYLMQITHVIRGEDHISNTPKQIAIQEALGFPRPIYAHLPMILGADRSKLSKRHGATSLTEYQKLGYLPEALINFLALLGWHPYGDIEIMSLEELIEKFELERVQKGGAIFNLQKLDWFNSQYLKKLPLEQVFQYFLDYLKTFHPQINTSQDNIPYLKQILELELPRINKFSELLNIANYFFEDKLQYPKELLSWKGETKEEVREALNNCLQLLQEIPESEFNQVNLQSKFANFINNQPLYQNNRGKILWPLRVALSGKEASAGPFEIAAILGKKETLNRIQQALSLINN